MKHKHNVISSCLVSAAIIAALSVSALSGDVKIDDKLELDAIIEQAKKIGNDQHNNCEFDLQIANKPLRLSISIQVPIATDKAEGAIRARNTLYAMAAGECALITQHIPGHCKITNFKIQQKVNQRRNALDQNHKQTLGANINFEIIPRAKKADCEK
ncbi:MAG: hypothetical protein GY743_20695 [Planctomycetaceae bacterium]|nr:hypothetical protein [Planctomycetaceae bacterium]